MKFTVSSVDHCLSDVNMTNRRLTEAFNDVQGLLQNQGPIVKAFDACQEAVAIASKISKGTEVSGDILKSLEAVTLVEFSVNKAECVLEGIGIILKENVAKFVAWIKELFVKLRIWVKSLIDHIRTRYHWATKDKLSDYIRKSGYSDDYVQKRTAGYAGKSIISAIVNVANDSKDRRKFVQSIVDASADNLDHLRGSIYFSSSTSITTLNGKLFEVGEDFELSTITNKEYSWIGNGDSENSGVSISQIVQLENAISTIERTFAEFENEVNVRQRALVTKLENSSVSEDLKLVKDKLMILKDAVVKNGNCMATFTIIVDTLFSKIRKSLGTQNDYANLSKLSPDLRDAILDAANQLGIEPSDPRFILPNLDLVGFIFNDKLRSDSTIWAQYIEQLLKAYSGKYEAVAKVGDRFDSNYMVELEIVSGDHNVKRVISQGLKIPGADRAFIKAVVE